MDDIYLNLFRRQLDQRVAQCFHRTIHVTLNDNIQFLEVTQSDTTTQFIQSKNLLRTQALFTSQLFTFVGDFTSFLVAFYHMERAVARFRAGSRPDREIHGTSQLLQRTNSHPHFRRWLFRIAGRRYTSPENPMKAMARIPAVISAIGTPLKALGTSSNSSLSRMPAKSTSARANPSAVATE